MRLRAGLVRLTREGGRACALCGKPGGTLAHLVACEGAADALQPILPERSSTTAPQALAILGGAVALQPEILERHATAVATVVRRLDQKHEKAKLERLAWKRTAGARRIHPAP